MQAREYVPEYCQRSTLILGCGNVLLGDDGFGPAVVKHLQEHYPLPQDVYALDVGTGIQDILCTIALSPQKPRRIVVIDAVDSGRKPGEVSMATIDNLPRVKRAHLSLHQLPTSDLLRDLKDCCGIEVVLVSAQPESIPESVQPGLSARLQAAVSEVCNYLEDEYLRSRA